MLDGAYHIPLAIADDSATTSVDYIFSCGVDEGLTLEVNATELITGVVRGGIEGGLDMQPGVKALALDRE